MKINSVIVIAATPASNFCYADCKQSAVIANQFINGYIKYNNAVYQQKSQETVVEWLQKNKTVTPHFKQSYQQLVTQAEKENPELGLNFDLILGSGSNL